MNYDKFASKLGDWGEALRPFIESEACDKIYEKLKYDSQRGKVICPQSKDTWRAFEETPMKELKMIMLLQDPYPRKVGKVFQADGIAMSCSHLKEPQPSLDIFYDAIEDDLKIKSGRYLDLAWLCHQGCMMLNSALTCELNKSSSHEELWKPFMIYFFNEVIATFPPGLVIALCGDSSKYYERCINPLQHCIVKLEHPAFAYRKTRGWEHKHLFSFSNRYLKDHGRAMIDWNLGPVPF